MGEAVDRWVKTPEETAQSARQLAPCLSPPLHIHLSGALGAGKTHWARAFLRAAGVRENVPSPSYALAYSYEVGARRYHHLDCYRLPDAVLPDELSELLADDAAICLVEWPDKIKMPTEADMRIDFVTGEGENRRLRFVASSPPAVAALHQWA